MKNLSNCKPSEFLAQTIKIKNLVRDWLDATKIMDIRKNFSQVGKNLTAEERTNAIVNQSLSNWSDMLEAIPAFICIFAMPFMYSISEGISFGVISFVVLNAVAGKAKKITPLMWVLAVLFILKYIFL